MSYTSGDWTARLKYLMGSNQCFPNSDQDAINHFLISFSSSNDVVYSYNSEPSPVPFFPLYNGPPASMQFGSTTNISLNDSSANLCSITLVTDVSGKVGVWASVDVSGGPVTLQINLDGSIVSSTSSSNFLFYGTPTAQPAGTYTIVLTASTTGVSLISSASLMAVGLLS